MARFFQHIEPGETQGKVTRLKYIDDISDDEMILYVFEDGTRCNKEFIAGPEDEDPLKMRKAMVELTSPNNQWIFEKHEIVPDEDRVIVGADGVRYQAPDPSAQTEGTGLNIKLKQEAKRGIRVEAKPPRKVLRYSIEPDDAYSLSVHPGLETGKEKAEQFINSSNIKTAVPQKKPSPAVTTTETDKTTANATENFDFDEAVDSSAVSKKESDENPPRSTYARPEFIPPKHKPTETVLSIHKESKTIKIYLPDSTEIELTVDEFLKRVAVSSDEIEKLKREKTNSLDEILNAEDVLIKNMIDKSKKNMCKISMNLTLNLPPQAVYDTIKSVYEPEMLDQFTNSLAARYLLQGNMLNSISGGLKAYYEKNSSAKKTASEQTTN